MSFVEPATSVLLAEAKPSNRNTIIAAFSNLSTAFNLININLAHVIMQNQYCDGDNCKAAVSAAGSACLAGAILGQLTFGYVGDCLGRGPAMQLTLLLSILGALSSFFAVPISGDSTPSSVFTFISITRFLLGLGVGGVYPLAATISQESSDEKHRGRNTALVFSMQGVGSVLVPAVGLLLITIFGTPADRAGDNNYAFGVGIQWRLLLGIGALPGILLAPFKVRKSSPAPANNEAATGTPAPPMSLMKALSTPRYLKKLIGTAGGWFIFDITFYGNTLFAPTVLGAIFPHEGPVPTDGSSLKDNLCMQLLIVALIGLPGYYVSACFMDKLGRKNIQLFGFAMMAVFYAIIGVWLNTMNAGLLLFVYGLTYFFSNFGPNATTFILPAETFPVEVRSTLNGFSAACGKAGALLGSSAFKPLAASAGTGAAMFVCAGCSVAGFMLTAVFVEDRRGKGMATGNSLIKGTP